MGAKFFLSSMVFTSLFSTQQFLFRYIRPEVLELNLQLSFLDLRLEIVKTARGRARDMPSVRAELPSMTRADELGLAWVPGH